MFKIFNRLNLYSVHSFGTLRINHRSFSLSSNLSAGHSKWANIKHIKALKDGQKAAAFVKLTRQIRFAIQEGGSSDPNLNSKLRMAIDEALRKNMPMSTIQNNIKKSKESKVSLSKYIMQLRVKQKVFSVVVCYTDNLPQVKMEVATVLRKCGGQHVDAMHMFDEFGLITAKYKSSVSDSEQFEEQVAEDAILSEAEDFNIVNSETGEVKFICRPTQLNAISKAIEDKGYEIISGDHVYSAKSTVQLTDAEQKDFEIFQQKLLAINGIEDIFDNIETGLA